MDVEELYRASRFAEFEQALKTLLVDTSLGPKAQNQVAARLGNYYRRIGAWKAADAIYRVLETTIDDRVGCRVILAKLARKAGRAAESAELYEQILPEIEAPSARAAAAFEAALARLAQGELSPAYAALSHVLDLDPGHSGAGLLKGLIETGGKAHGARIVQALVNPAEMAELAQSVAWHPTSDWPASRFRWLSHPAYMGPESVDDASFVVTTGQDRPVLMARLWRTADGIEAGDEMVHLLQAKGAVVSEKQMAAAILHLRALCAAFGGRPLIADQIGPDLSELGHACLKQGFGAEMKVGLEIDLSQPVESLWQGLRSSNHALIHRGEERLTLKILDRDHPDWPLLDALRQCHYLSVPIPEAEALFFTFPILKDEIEAGRAELSIADHDGRPAAAVLIFDDGPVSHYGVARYPRDHSDIASRFSLWAAILRAKARGQERFHLGHYGFDAASQGKMRTIADFKAGFTRTRRNRMTWRVC